MSDTFERMLALAEPTLAATRVAAGSDVRPEAARSLLEDRLQVLRAEAERARIAAKDVDDVVYALAAYADEVMLARARTREAWLPRLLQLALFGENAAGEGFFVRLDAIRRDPSRGHVLYVYAVVLALGFRGRYAAEDAARLELAQSIHLDLGRAGAETEGLLCPNAIPLRSQAEAPLDPRWALATGLAACVLAAVTWALFALDLWVHAGVVLSS